MSHVFHRDPRLEYPVAVRGEGAYLYDREGKRYLDASGGAAVSCLGHSDPAVIATIQRQIEKQEAQLDELVGKLARALAALEEE
jgi:hypothetical protein